MAPPICAWDGCDRTEIVARGLCNRCHVRARRAGRIHEFNAPPRECRVCHTTFTTGSRGRNTYCSDNCAATANEWDRVNKRLAVIADRVCARCAGPIPVSLRRDARFCSVACQQGQWYADNEERLRAAAREWAQSNRELRNDHEHRRRARALSNGYEPIDREAVWARDRGHCWICGEEIDPNVRYPDPLSPSLDHVIPISKGGGHVMRNVAMSHLHCNVSKKARVLAHVPIWQIEGGGDDDVAA